MKISRLVLELAIGYIFVNALNKADFNSVNNLLEEKINDINPKISNIYNEINYMYSIENDINFKPKELKEKIKEVQKEIDAIDSEEVASFILDRLNK